MHTLSFGIGLALFLGCSAPETPSLLIAHAAEKTPTTASTPPKASPSVESKSPEKNLQSLADIEPYFDSPDGITAQDAFRSRRYPEALDLFDALARDPERPELKRPAQYMAAVSLFYTGDWQGAEKRFAVLIPSYPLLQTYPLYFQAESLRRQGKNKEALPVYLKIPMNDGNGERAGKAAMILAGEMGKFETASRLCEDYTEVYGASVQVWMLWAKALEKTRKHEEAAQRYRAIMTRWPLTESSRKALKELKTLAKSKGSKKRKKWVRLTREESLERANRLFETHQSKEAALAFQSLAAQEKKGNERRCYALHHVARSFDKLRARKKSAPWHNKAVLECGQSTLYPKILYFSGKSAFQLGDHPRTLRVFKSLHTRFPDVSFNDDAWIWEAQLHASEKAPKKRRRALLDAQEKMPDGDMNEQVEWLLLWDAYRAKKWKEVIRLVDQSLRVRPRATYKYAEGRRLYWKARSLEKLGMKKDASALYGLLQESYPLSFYAILGFQRLALNEGIAAANAVVNVIAAREKILPNTLPQWTLSKESKERLGKTLELLRIGLPSPALRELERSGFGKVEEEAWLLSRLLAEAGFFSRSYALTRRYRNTYSTHFPVGDAEEYWNLAFPRAYEEPMTHFAKQAGIPPEFGMAIMRTESAFNPSVESWANAIGLMQLLIPTAQDLSRKGETTPNRQQLKIPERNIQLGTRFLGQLYGRFQHICVSSAGYNAGGGALGRWFKARGHLPFDEFVETIPFREARRYVKSVTSSYATYTYLRTGSMLRVPLKFPR